MEAHALAPRDFFAPARADLDTLIIDLQAPAAFELQEAQIEELVVVRGREVLNKLLQGFLDSRSADRPVGAVVDAQGVARTQHRVADRNLATQVGPVGVTRGSFSKPGQSSLRPLDAALNLPEHLFSFPLRKCMAEQAANTSFERAQETLTKQTGIVMGKRQMEEEVQRAATDFSAFYEQRQQKPPLGGSARALRSRTSSLLILSSDGKGIAMHTQDLREETRKKAEANHDKHKKRLSPGEKKNRKRMAEVAAVYTLQPQVRTSADIVRTADAPVLERPKPENKRVWASVTDSLGEVIGEMFEEASWRDPERGKAWVALVDGNLPQLDAIEREAKAHAVEVFVLVDIIHVLEYFWKAALPLHGGEHDAAETWVTEHLEALLVGDSRHVAAGIRRSATLRGLRGRERKAVDVCADYLRDYAPYLRYAEALAAGYPIATGVIEGACRHLVQDRMGLTGARWCLASAEAVLQLRALQSSGDWEEYWTFHQQKEYERNHAARYVDARAPAMVSPGKPRLRRVK